MTAARDAFIEAKRTSGVASSTLESYDDDSVAGHYTLCHSLSTRAARRIIALAQAVRS